jgi:hypothetical protein
MFADALTAMVSLLSAMHATAALGSGTGSLSLALIKEGAGVDAADLAMDSALLLRLAAIDRSFGDTVHLAAAFLQVGGLPVCVHV